MIEFVLENMEIVTAIATLILAGAAAYSAIQSKNSVNAIQKSRYDEFRPFLVPQDGGRRNGKALQFGINNNGKGPLFSLQILNKDLNPHLKTTLDVGDGHAVTLKNIDVENFDQELTFQYKDIYSRNFQTVVETKFQSGKPVGMSSNFRQIEV